MERIISVDVQSGWPKDYELTVSQEGGVGELAYEGFQDFRHWKQRQINFQFDFGIFNLFSVPLRSMVINIHFTKLMMPAGSVILPPIDFDQSADCARIESHPIVRPLPRIHQTADFIRYVSFQYVHYYIDMEGSFDSYLRKFSHKSRYNLLRSVKIYNKFCGNEKPWKEFSQPAEMEEFYRQAREVSRKTYQERLIKSGLPTREGFLEELKQMASRDAIRGYILFHGDKPVSYLYCPVHHGTVVLYTYVGYDSEYGRLSPGTVLQYYALQSLFKERRYQVFDLTPGGGPSSHKKFFSNRSVLCADIYYFKRSLRNKLIILSHFVLRIVSEKLIKLLEGIGVKDKLKRWFKK